MRCKRITAVLCISVLLFLTACGAQSVSDKKVQDIDYTVVTDADVPDTLRNAIEEKKEEPFKLSYSDGAELYIVIGYGKQPSGGFSIVVDDLYLTESNILFATTLKGPEKEAESAEAPTYPYLIVKMEYMDKEILYK